MDPGAGRPGAAGQRSGAHSPGVRGLLAFFCHEGRCPSSKHELPTAVDILVVAGCGSGWVRAGHPGPGAAPQQAAVAFLHRVLAAAGREPRVIITDKLASYAPAVK